MRVKFGKLAYFVALPVIAAIGYIALWSFDPESKLRQLIDERFPPVSAEERQLEQAQRSAHALGQISPNIIVNFPSSLLSERANQALIDAVNAIVEENPSISISNPSLRFGKQGPIVEADLTYQIRDPIATKIEGSLRGYAGIAIEGTDLVIAPALKSFRVSSLEVEAAQWNLREAADVVNGVIAELIDNINGSIQPTRIALPLAPLGTPDARAVPVNISIGNQTLSFVPPMLKGGALLIEPERVAVLAEVTLDDEEPPAPDNVPAVASFDDYRRMFMTAASQAGLNNDGSNRVELHASVGLLRTLLARHTEIVGADTLRDQSAALVDAQLDALKSPDVGAVVILAAVLDLLSERANELLATALDQRGVRMAEPLLLMPELGRVLAATRLVGSVPNSLVEVTLDTTLQFTIEVAEDRVLFVPAIYSITLLDVVAEGFDDLDLGRLLSSVNVMMVPIIEAINSHARDLAVAIEIEFPAPREIPLATLAKHVDGLSISPETISVDAIHIHESVAFVDPERVRVIGDWESGPKAAPAQSGGIASADMAAVQRKLDAIWQTHFTPLDSIDADAGVLVKSAPIASFVMDSFNRAKLTIAYDLGVEERIPRTAIGREGTYDVVCKRESCDQGACKEGNCTRGRCPDSNSCITDHCPLDQCSRNSCERRSCSSCPVVTLVPRTALTPPVKGATPQCALEKQLCETDAQLDFLACEGAQEAALKECNFRAELKRKECEARELWELGQCHASIKECLTREGSKYESCLKLEKLAFLECETRKAGEKAACNLKQDGMMALCEAGELFAKPFNNYEHVGDVSGAVSVVGGAHLQGVVLSLSPDLRAVRFETRVGATFSIAADVVVEPRNLGYLACQFDARLPLSVRATVPEQQIGLSATVGDPRVTDTENGLLLVLPVAVQPVALRGKLSPPPIDVFATGLGSTAVSCPLAAGLARLPLMAVTGEIHGPLLAPVREALCSKSTAIKEMVCGEFEREVPIGSLDITIPVPVLDVADLSVRPVIDLVDSGILVKMDLGSRE